MFQHHESAAAFADMHGMCPTPYIDQFGMVLTLPSAMHSNQIKTFAPAHWDMQRNGGSAPRNEGKFQVRSNAIKEEPAPGDPRLTGNAAAVSDCHRISFLDPLGIKQDKKCISPALRITETMNFVKALDAAIVPDQFHIEIGIDMFEKFMQDDRTRAYMLAHFLFHSKAARSIDAPLRASKEKGSSKTVKTMEAAIRLLMEDYVLFRGNRKERQIKAYIKRHDSIDGQAYAPLPPNLHRGRIEIRLCGEHCPIKEPAQLENLVPFASMFSMFMPKPGHDPKIKWGLESLSPCSMAAPKRRKNPTEWCIDSNWYDRIKGKFRRASDCFKRSQ